MSYATGDVVTRVFDGIFRISDTTIPTDADTFNIYQIDTDDNHTIVETLVHENIKGTLDLAVVDTRTVQDLNFEHSQERFLFIPYKFIVDPLPVVGNKVVDNNNTIYKIEFIEDLYTHQEITLRRINA